MIFLFTLGTLLLFNASEAVQKRNLRSNIFEAKGPTVSGPILTKECTVQLKETRYADNTSKATYQCKLDPQDANGLRNYVITIKDGDKLENYDVDILPGKTTIYAEDSYFLDGKLELGPNIRFGMKDDNNDNSGRRLATTTGQKKVLIVKVRTSFDGAETSLTEERLSDSVFGNNADGNGADQVTLKSQYALCSHRKMTIEPVVRNGVTNGAMTINIPASSSDGDDAIENAAIAELESIFGTVIENVVDHVLLCLPPDSVDGIAYANWNGAVSVYEDRWCSYVSNQMHEVGHNLNLGHSGEDGGQYEDRSCLMGFSYSENDTSMCFNPVKNYQLGWFENRQEKIYPLTMPSPRYTTNLVGVVDYDTASPDQFIVVKLVTLHLTRDYFLGFNRATSFNSDTREGRNQVTVHSRGRGVRSTSTLEAKLSAGSRFTIVGTTTIIVESISTSSGVAVVTVTKGEDTSPTPSNLCDPMRNLINGDEVCVNTATVCEATADLVANGKESCDAWCERSDLTCVGAWDDGTSDCERRGTIPCSETGNSWSICRCEGSSNPPPPPPPTRNPTPYPTTNPTSSPTKNPTSSPTKSPTQSPTKNPTSSPTKNPTPARNPTSSPTKNPAPLCNGSLSNLVVSGEVCTNTNQVCEAKANLNANGKESCDDWCSRDNLVCNGAWDDGQDECKKDRKISCDETGNGYSICKCGLPQSPPQQPQGFCDFYNNLTDYVLNNEICENSMEACEVTANLDKNGRESCNEFCQRANMVCDKAWDDGVEGCTKNGEISCSDSGKKYSVCRCKIDFGFIGGLGGN